MWEDLPSGLLSTSITLQHQQSQPLNFLPPKTLPESQKKEKNRGKGREGKGRSSGAWGLLGEVLMGSTYITYHHKIRKVARKSKRWFFCTKNLIFFKVVNFVVMMISGMLRHVKMIPHVAKNHFHNVLMHQNYVSKLLFTWTLISWWTVYFRGESKAP